jgi:hypothetical protein
MYETRFLVNIHDEYQTLLSVMDWCKASLPEHSWGIEFDKKNSRALCIMFTQAKYKTLFDLTLPGGKFYTLAQKDE